MRRVRIHAAAAEEAAEAAAWYERERPGLGVDFERAMDAALDLLEEELVPLVSVPGIAGTRGVKRLLLRRFPYSVIVRESATEVIVVAFAHTARRPGYWRGRLKSSV
jgi:plasmid stabilization system protein ParE